MPAPTQRGTLWPPLSFYRAKSSIENPPGGSCLPIKDIHPHPPSLSCAEGEEQAPFRLLRPRGLLGSGALEEQLRSVCERVVTAPRGPTLWLGHSLRSTAPWHPALKRPRLEAAVSLLGCPTKPFLLFRPQTLSELSGPPESPPAKLKAFLLLLLKHSPPQREPRTRRSPKPGLQRGPRSPGRPSPEMWGLQGVPGPWEGLGKGVYTETRLGLGMFTL